MKTRRFFAGNTLPQALMAAARYHGLPPEELAYLLREKRHGFVTRIRRFIVEVDPAAPQRTQRESPPAPPAAREPRRSGAGRQRLPRPKPTTAAVRKPPRVASAARPAQPRPAARAAATARTGHRAHGEPFLPPDEESELAAAVAVGRLLALAGLDLTVQGRAPTGPPGHLARRARTRRFSRDLGEEFLDDIEHLAPRAIRGLTGRMVRCRVEGAGLRSAREDELRSLAERAAEEAVASGEAVLLEPLSAAERRIVHLALVDDPRVTTESEGLPPEKRIRISPAAAPTSR